jgi:hypothetical protein
MGDSAAINRQCKNEQTLKQILVTILTISHLGCGQSENKTDVVAEQDIDTTAKVHIDNLISKPDTSNQNIYDFMKVVIADQKLALSYGLTLEPQPNCDLSQDDQTFLNTQLYADTSSDRQQTNL